MTGDDLVFAGNARAVKEIISALKTHFQLTAPIVGARDVKQLAPSLKSLDIKMTQELWDQVAALSRTPAPATDRVEEYEPVKVRPVSG